MGANKFSNLKKCGEILLDIKSKNRKNKIFIFHCTLCNLQCDQLKKFSLHIGDEHLGASSDILNESELKFEAEVEELGVQEFSDIETPDIKVFEKSTSKDRENLNLDPLGVVNTVLPTVKQEILNSEVKHELKGDCNDESNLYATEIVDCAASIDDSDKETEEAVEIAKTNTDINFVDDSDSDDNIIDSGLDQIPLKKRKLNNVEKDQTSKQKHNKIDMTSDESKDAEYNVEKDCNAIKKHKRCKRRWKKIDDSKLPMLIKIYKKYEILWQVNDIAFGIVPKRNELFTKMNEELKLSDNFNKNLNELRDYIDYINYIFRKDKEQELKSESDKTEFKPSSKYYKELSFLSDSQGPFKCPNCNEIITKYDHFHIHVAQHNGSIPFQCRLCEKGFQKFDNYLIHISRHLGINSYHCDVCGKGYPIKSELDWHLTSHTGVKPFLCSVCGTGFRARHAYDNHIRRHEKRFRYECHICKRGFNHLGKLNTHIKTHLNIRDVICNVCGKGFTAVKYLRRHKLIHDEEKRYKCNVCGKAFAQDAGLRAHRKQHQPYAMLAENKNVL